MGFERSLNPRYESMKTSGGGRPAAAAEAARLAAYSETAASYSTYRGHKAWLSRSGFVPMKSTRAPAATIFSTADLRRAIVTLTDFPAARSFSPHTQSTREGANAASIASASSLTSLQVPPPTPTLCDLGNVVYVLCQ